MMLLLHLPNTETSNPPPSRSSSVTPSLNKLIKSRQALEKNCSFPSQGKDLMRINRGTRSLVVCRVPGRSHWKFHAPLHTENVVFIRPTKSKIKGRMNCGVKWMRMAYLCRCESLKCREVPIMTHTRQSNGQMPDSAGGMWRLWEPDTKGRNLNSK